MGSIGKVEICAFLVGSDEAASEAFAGASMRGLRHKVRHKIRAAWGTQPSASIGFLGTQRDNFGHTLLKPLKTP